MYFEKIKNILEKPVPFITFKGGVETLVQNLKAEVLILEKRFLKNEELLTEASERTKKLESLQLQYENDLEEERNKYKKLEMQLLKNEELLTEVTTRATTLENLQLQYENNLEEERNKRTKLETQLLKNKKLLTTAKTRAKKFESLQLQYANDLEEERIQYQKLEKQYRNEVLEYRSIIANKDQKLNIQEKIYNTEYLRIKKIVESITAK